MVKIITGDCLDVLKTLPDASVHCCVTSPPYWGLRDYGCTGQIGLEATPEEYVAKMVEVFREVRRVLREDGTLWLNLGDSYSRDPGKGGSGPNGKHDFIPDYGLARKAMRRGTGRADGIVTDESPRNRDGAPPCDLPQKNLIGIPWRVAFALQADGWYLRQDIIWHKPNPMPESVTDRCTKAHEYVFLLAKSPKYHYDAAAIAEPSVYADGCNGSTFDGDRDLAIHPTVSRKPRQSVERGGFGGKTADQSGREAFRAITQTRNRRDVWTVPTAPYSGAHFATFPPALIRPMILAGCPVGGTVLDPFGGSGTTGEVAEMEGRNSILIELNPQYVALAEKRTAQRGLFCEPTTGDG